MSKAYVHIIAEEIGTSWQAWFACSPDEAYSGAHPAQAIERLLDTYGKAEFNINEIDVLDDQTTTTHHEYRVPFVRLNRIPKSSNN